MCWLGRMRYTDAGRRRVPVEGGAAATRISSDATKVQYDFDRPLTPSRNTDRGRSDLPEAQKVTSQRKKVSRLGAR
jgi:hypothetical protein